MTHKDQQKFTDNFAILVVSIICILFGVYTLVNTLLSLGI